jgi:hypothetical protein
VSVTLQLHRKTLSLFVERDEPTRCYIFQCAAASRSGLKPSILNEIGAAEYLQSFIDDDRDDDSIKTLANFNVEKNMKKYGLPRDKVSAFSDKCRSISWILAPPKNVVGQHFI